MARLLPHAVRTGATVVGIAAGLLALGYSGQSTDGYVHVAFTGPLGLFGPDSVDTADSDVIAIGGPGDGSAIAALLKSTAPRTNPSSDQPNRISLESGTTSDATGVNAFPAAGAPVAAGPVAPAATGPGTTPAVDEQGRVDCTGAVSCLLDPKTNVTTVTYSDGTMAIVQRINGMTLVDYKTVPQNLNDKAPSPAKAPAPQSVPAPLPVAAVPAKPSPLASVPVPAPASAPTTDTPAAETAPDVNPGPAATAPSESLPSINSSTVRPRVTVTTTPQDYNPSRPSAPAAASTSQPGVSRAIDAVKDVVSSVVDAVGKAVNPGASTGAKRSNTN